ncbi:exported protein of unknown function [Micropruina glycogenica]|uniref:Uncharacterized protein n=1 Tax=Micropruina glycogenica TaxID=75385 RepID=A0A2N9JMN2_9ACTN|nr:exported protein of unknown function [Micropruina glycogenica]
MRSTTTRPASSASAAAPPTASQVPVWSGVMSVPSSPGSSAGSTSVSDSVADGLALALPVCTLLDGLGVAVVACGLGCADEPVMGSTRPISSTSSAAAATAARPTRFCPDIELLMATRRTA